MSIIFSKVNTPDHYFNEIEGCLYFNHIEENKVYKINEIERDFLRRLIDKQISQEIRFKILFLILVVPSYAWRMLNFRDVPISPYEGLGLILVLGFGLWLISKLAKRNFQNEIHNFIFSRPETKIDATRKQYKMALIKKMGPGYFWLSLGIGIVCIILGISNYFQNEELNFDVFKLLGLGGGTILIGLYGLFKIRSKGKN